VDSNPRSPYAFFDGRARSAPEVKPLVVPGAVPVCRGGDVDMLTSLRLASRLAVETEIVRAFCFCTVCIVVLDAEKIDRLWSTFTPSRRSRMSTLDEITKEKQRVSEACARRGAAREAPPAS
jgi:hypothetical protein